MNIGLVDVDSHNFPNFALMRLSAWHKAHGDHVEWADAMFGRDYDRVYKSKIFTFSPDNNIPWECEVICGGTGYDIKSRLPGEIEQSTLMDYSLYPQYHLSIQFFSRGCIRNCPFCLVRDKEGYITPVEPVQLNPTGKWIEVLDNNFFANPEWKASVDYLIKLNQPVNLHGVDIRIMNEEQAYWLNKLRLKRSHVHIAWDLPDIDLTEKLREVTRYIAPWKMSCYIHHSIAKTLQHGSTNRRYLAASWILQTSSREKALYAPNISINKNNGKEPDKISHLCNRRVSVRQKVLCRHHQHPWHNPL